MIYDFAIGYTGSVSWLWLRVLWMRVLWVNEVEGVWARIPFIIFF